MKSSFLLFSVVVLVLGIVSVSNAAGLERSFYRKTCPLAESIVRNVTWTRVASDRALAAKLLRIHYHDCFVRGCDASILLDSTNTSTSEKAAGPNLALSGYDVIDSIKSRLEKVCPGTVSCADIVTLSARDAVSFQFRRSMWKVLTGRRDGNVSLASEVLGEVPSPFSNFATLKQLFARKGLNVTDLVALSGAHTIGVSRCGVAGVRIFNFTGKGDADPSLNPNYVKILKTKCSNATTTTTVEMDPNNSLSFNSHYFKVLNAKKGLFQSDAALLTDPASAQLVKLLEDPKFFIAQFANSMVNMGAIEVLTGNEGEIRKQCRVPNS